MNLRQGDVVRLDGAKITDDFKLKIGKRKKFLCRPGKVGNHIAIQIGKQLSEIPDDMYIAKRKLEERNQEGRQIL
ncbi:MAG: FliM/FliN family flagellar motor switch protein, partial [Actinomycetia bacterium]|nr:FliM/FliN family flagellar motor switch protein [Actinomycetes bacterium]